MPSRHPTETRWHYTVGQYFDAITKAGLLRPATAGVPIGERPAVWFSVNPVWEETANKSLVAPGGRLIPGTRETTHSRGGGLLRFGVAPHDAPHDWESFKKMSGIVPKHARGLYAAAVSCGARPGEWYVSFEPVPREKWLTVEWWNGEEWTTDRPMK